jgi:septal ring factor EnvC (AmiA/AmiB activator)
MFDLSGISSTFWKILCGVLAAITVFTCVMMGVRSCNATKLDNERLETIQQLQSTIHEVENEKAQMQICMDGMQTEINMLTDKVAERETEIATLSELHKTETQAIENETKIVEGVYEAVRKDEKAYNWFDEQVPDSILDVFNSCVSVGDESVCLPDHQN